MCKKQTRSSVLGGAAAPRYGDNVFAAVKRAGSPSSRSDRSVVKGRDRLMPQETVLCLKRPRLAHRSMAEGVGLCIAHELFGIGIPPKFAAKFH